MVRQPVWQTIITVNFTEFPIFIALYQTKLHHTVNKYCELLLRRATPFPQEKKFDLMPDQAEFKT